MLSLRPKSQQNPQSRASSEPQDQWNRVNAQAGGPGYSDNNWSDSGGIGLEYRRENGIVFIRGTIDRTSSDPITAQEFPIFELPEGYRPTRRMFFPALSNDNSSPTVLEVNPTAVALSELKQVSVLDVAISFPLY